MLCDPLVDRLIELALLEDLSLGDVTTEATIPHDQLGMGKVAAKASFTIAGLDVATRVFAAVDPALVVTWNVVDGARVAKGDVVGTATGPTRSLLMAERTVLNFLQRLSGIATATRQFTDAVAGTRARIVCTRKTTPGWRVLEKAAVRAGGGHNHRFSLGSGVLIKDNHVDSGGGVAQAIAAARRYAPHSLRIEIEVRTAAELQQAVDAGADVVLLDNMDRDTLRDSVAKARLAGVMSEASGGVTLERVRAVADAGVDLISIGALTHSAVAMDINMKVRPL
ncbi:MAG: nicotinate-nucleotide pyrophosphorylase (carboxylating) [Myxococcota bacterium]|jgi:nicotinate-nucleotide pyrophosphorylase (carboxylating)